MTDPSRRRLLWAVLVIAISLTVVNLVDLVRGDTSVSIWIGLVCWPIVAIANVYQLATHTYGRRSDGRSD
jgi:hypothetical protein